MRAIAGGPGWLRIAKVIQYVRRCPGKNHSPQYDARLIPLPADGERSEIRFAPRKCRAKHLFGPSLSRWPGWTVSPAKRRV